MSQGDGDTNAPPVGPGEVLRKYLIGDDRITQDELSRAMGVSRFSINQIINGRRSITAEMALRLGHVTSTSPSFWLNLQRAVDVFKARQALGNELSKLPVIRSPKTDEELFHDVAE